MGDESLKHDFDESHTADELARFFLQSIEAIQLETEDPKPPEVLVI
jgi:hypothetical protein